MSFRGDPRGVFDENFVKGTLAQMAFEDGQIPPAYNPIFRTDVAHQTNIAAYSLGVAVRLADFFTPSVSRPFEVLRREVVDSLGRKERGRLLFQLGDRETEDLLIGAALFLFEAKRAEYIHRDMDIFLDKLTGLNKGRVS